MSSPRAPRWGMFVLRPLSQMPERSGLPSAVRGAGAVRSGCPAAFRGTFGVRIAGHCAASSIGVIAKTKTAIRTFIKFPPDPGSSLRPQHEALCAPIVDDLSSVKIPLRGRRHVMDDIELTWFRSAAPQRAYLCHRRSIEDNNAHWAGIDNIQ